MSSIYLYVTIVFSVLLQITANFDDISAEDRVGATRNFYPPIATNPSTVDQLVVESYTMEVVTPNICNSFPNLHKQTLNKLSIEEIDKGDCFYSEELTIDNLTDSLTYVVPYLKKKEQILRNGNNYWSYFLILGDDNNNLLIRIYTFIIWYGIAAGHYLRRM